MKNVFVVDGRITIAFVDSKGTLAGDLMKEIQSRRPEIILELKKVLDEAGETAVGQGIKIDDYLFLVNKKDYRNKFDMSITGNMLVSWTMNIRDKEFKTYLDPKLPENFIQYMKDLGIRLYDRVDWSPKEKLEVLEWEK